jgi:hypothetical protein
MTGSGWSYSFIFASAYLIAVIRPDYNGDTSKQTLTIGAYGPKRTFNV